MSASLALAILVAAGGASRTAPAAACAGDTMARGVDGTIAQCLGREKPLPAGVARPQGDPDLEPGFPVQGFHGPGSYQGGPVIHTLVGNIDGDPQLEILRTALAAGPVYAWNHDGTPVAGWPAPSVVGTGYIALGELAAASPGREVFSGFLGGRPQGLTAWNGGGMTLPGWPRDNANYTGFAPSLSDVDGDGLDEIFVEEEDYKLHAYRADGTVLPGWPAAAFIGTQLRNTSAITDLDGDGTLDIVTITGASSAGAFLLAYHRDGTLLSGFPAAIPSPYVETFPAIGDVDGDGKPDIVLVAANPSAPSTSAALVFSEQGVLKRTVPASTGTFYGSAPALADLDGDGLPDIVVQTNEGLYAWKGDGTPLPGWPRTWTGRWLGNSSPVVGDVTGDGQPDVVVTTQQAGSSVNGDVRVYDAHGVPHPHFPKALAMGSGAVPAIADIDLDGRNEIIVSGAFWNGVSGDYDLLWAYDLGGGTHGAVPWGQFMHDGRHTGTYSLSVVPTMLTQATLVVDPSPLVSNGNGVLEPGETVVAAPTWSNAGPVVTALSGTAISFTGPTAPGVSYAITDGGALYGDVATGQSSSCLAHQDCYAVAVAATGARPSTHWDTFLDERLSTTTGAAWTLHVGGSFTDVSAGDGFYRFVETVLHQGVTAGCAAHAYCPAQDTLRAQMAVFVLRARFGTSYLPPDCQPGMQLFDDVPAADPFCRWVEDLARRGVVTGCGPTTFCPESPVSRDQMAVFLLRTAKGSTPPACVAGRELFSDVPASSAYCRWIEELARRGITAGCGGGRYCPSDPVTRGQMAVFLTATFGLTLYP